MMPHFLDTNILLYSISRNPAESFKRDRALALLDDDSGALSIQVLQEFYVQATRASRADAVPHETRSRSDRGVVAIQHSGHDPSNPQRGIANSQDPWVFILGQRHRRRRSVPRLRPGVHRRLGPWASGGWPRHY